VSEFGFGVQGLWFGVQGFQSQVLGSSVRGLPCPGLAPRVAPPRPRRTPPEFAAAAAAAAVAAAVFGGQGSGLSI
jgi:hypothetical protein